MVELLANLSAILTALVAVIGYGVYRYDRFTKRRQLESYLKNEKEIGVKTSTNKGQRSIIHLIAKLGLTETEILQASFNSKKIKRAISLDSNTGMAADLLLECQGKDSADS